MTVVKAELRQVSVRSGEGSMMIFQINDKTRITRDGKPVTLTQITVGDQVTVSYEKSGENNVAVSIGVTEPKA